MLTAHGEEADRIIGLEYGADVTVVVVRVRYGHSIGSRFGIGAPSLNDVAHSDRAYRHRHQPIVGMGGGVGLCGGVTGEGDSSIRENVNSRYQLCG
jgi:hypothetical protein